MQEDALSPGYFPGLVPYIRMRITLLLLKYLDLKWSWLSFVLESQPNTVLIVLPWSAIALFNIRSKAAEVPKLD